MLAKRLNLLLKRFVLKAWLVNNHAFFVSAVGVFVLFASMAVRVAVADCSLDAATLKALPIVSVGKVSDGDSLVLSDGRRLRLAFINTPEVHLSESLALEAGQALSALVLNKTLYFRKGVQRLDKYGRLLGDLYTADGRSISMRMLEMGWGFLVVIPPNVVGLPCFLKARDSAQSKRLGVWSLPDYQGVSSVSFKPSDAGFRRVTGRLEGLSHHGDSWWLNLEGDIVLRIRPNHQSSFIWLQLQAAVGRRVLASGWVVDRGKRQRFSRRRYMLLLTHPAHLTVL